MAIEKIKVGGFVSTEIAKINANFNEIETNYAKTSAIPTTTSQLTNNSGYITENDVPVNVSEFENDAGYITTADIPTVNVPTKTSDLTNDSGYVTNTTVASGYVAKESGKGLSSNDYTDDEKTKLAGLAAPETKAIAVANWTASGNQYKCTLSIGSKKPGLVMRKNGATYNVALVDISISGTNVILTSDETFEGYIVCI